MAQLDPILMVEIASATEWPEETKFAKVINLIGGTPTYDSLTRTCTITIDGSGAEALNVTYENDGTLTAFPQGANRLASSNGSTPGGNWDVKTKTVMDAAIANNSLGLPKIHGGGATNGQVLKFNSTSGLWEPGNEQTIPSPPAVPVTSVTGTGYATVTHEGTVWNVYVPEPGEPAPETVVMYPSIGSVIHQTSGFDPTDPGDIINHAAATVGQTFFYLSAQTDQGPYVVTNNTPGSVVAERHSSWSGIKDLSVKYMWPVSHAMDTGSMQCLIYTTSNSGTTTVGTGSTSFATTLPQNHLACPNTYQDHPACTVHATVPITDLAHCPNIIDGHEFNYGAVDTRIFLSKQVSTKENGPWELHQWNEEDSTWVLSRPADWLTGSMLRAGTTHRFQVLSGDLWPAHIVELYIGAPMYIWGGVGIATGDWNVSMTTIPDCDATEGTIAVDADWEYIPRGCSSTERKSVRVTGWIKAGEDYRAGIFEGATQEIPLDVDPAYDAYNYPNATDDLGGGWKTGSSANYVYQDTAVKTQGPSSWKLGTGGEAGGMLRKNFTLPGNHRGAVRAKVKKATAMGANTFRFNVGTYNPAQPNAAPSDLSLNTVTNSTTWSSFDVPIAASTDVRTISMAIVGDTATHVDIGNIDAVQFVHTIDGFSSRLYIDAEYGPASDPKCIYYADDTQEEQVDDSSNQLGGPTLCGLDMDTNCRLFMPSLGIERHYAFTMLMTPISEVVTAPGLPAETTLPAYPW